jgi:hypothetical protein
LDKRLTLRHSTTTVQAMARSRKIAAPRPTSSSEKAPGESPSRALAGAAVGEAGEGEAEGVKDV